MHEITPPPPEDLKKLLGLRVQQLRKEHHWTQKELAAICEVDSDRVVRKWEHGERFPWPRNLAALANAFNVSVGDLFDFDFTEET